MLVSSTSQRLAWALLLPGCSLMGLFDAPPGAPDSASGSSPDPGEVDSGGPSTDLGGPDEGGSEAGPEPETFRVAQMCAGAGYTCLLGAGGTIRCIGENARGQLGDGTTIQRMRPVIVRGVGDAVQVACGEAHACARRASGEVLCWGTNAWGELGSPVTPSGEEAYSSLPVSVVGLIASDVAAGWAHTCARREDGQVVCWGTNEAGQLGDPASPGGPSPVPITGVDDGRGLAAGRDHSCAIQNGALPYGPVLCWGANGDGQLGSFPAVPPIGPALVTEIDDVRQLSLGWWFSCGVRYRGLAACWGAGNRGQLGNGTTDGSVPPVGVATLTDAVAIGAGYVHTCARSANGTVWCWGNNDAGQLGDGTTSPSLVPVAVDGVEDTVELCVGFGHNCVRRLDDRVLCWGGNLSGQLGDGTTDFHSTPIELQP